LPSHVLPWAQLATVKITWFMLFDGGGELARNALGSANFEHRVRVSPLAIEWAVEASAVQCHAGRRHIVSCCWHHVGVVIQSNGAGRLKLFGTFDGPGAS
jgi:hypothetical protein